MLPRRSSVVRYLMVAVVFVIAFLWLASDSHSKGNDFDDLKDVTSSLSVANVSELVEEFNKLRLEYGEENSLVLPLGPKNYSLLELRQHVLKLEQHRPKNPHPFHYVIKPSAVCTDDVFLLVYVHSAPGHFKQRMAIRETWGNSRNFPDTVIKVIFLCGIIPTSEGRAIQDALSLEADTYGDIVQENFVDSYRNLTYKGIMGLKWVSSYCQNAQFLLKSDDDIFINIFSLVKHLQRISSQRGKPIRNLLLCLVWYRMKVMRDPRSKWYLSHEEFSADVFPTYCSGSAFIMTTDVAAAMFNVSFRVPFFWVDDFYVTGLLAREAGITHENFNSVYMLSPSAFLQKFSDPNVSLTLVVGHVHKINSLKVVWSKVLAEQQRQKNVVSGTATKQSPSNS